MPQGRFVSGELKQFTASGRKIAVDVIIPSSLAANFDVIEKAFLPENTLKPDGSRIIWINNIGLKAKNTSAAVNDYYEVQITRANTNLSRIDRVYLFVNGQAQPLAQSDFDLDFNGKVTLRLNLIDPPIGLDGR
jgi:hypothetical protein